MTSVLNVDTIAAKDGISPVGLTKQKAMVVCAGFNMHSDTKFVANNTAFSENLNTSSFTDSGTGNLKTFLINSLANNQFIITSAAVTANNNVSVYTDSTVSLIHTNGYDSDSSATQDNVQYFHVTGSLA